MQYKDVEAALCRLFAVADGDRGRLRGRIRHLRDLGVPVLPKPGTGPRIDYSRENAIHLAIALRFEADGIGLDPVEAARFSAEILPDAIKYVPSEFVMEHGAKLRVDRGPREYIVGINLFVPTGPRVIILARGQVSPERFTRLAVGGPGFLQINLGRIIRDLDVILDEL